MPALTVSTFLMLAALTPGGRSLRTSSDRRVLLEQRSVEDHLLEGGACSKAGAGARAREGPGSRFESDLDYHYNRSRYRMCWSVRDWVFSMQPIVIPHLKLAFCYISKNACTQFKDLFNSINHRPWWSQGFGHGYTESFPSTLRVSMKDVTKENGWKFASFFRDPAERYVSIFGSTCVPRRWGTYEHDFACCGPLAGKASREELVEILKRRVQADLSGGLPWAEDHWGQQVDMLRQCGWEKFKPSQLDFVGTLDRNLSAQVIEMMSMVGFADTALVKHYFPDDHVAGHTNPLPGGAKEFVKDPETLRGIMKLYEDDYRLLPGVGCSFTKNRIQLFRDENATT